MSNTSGERTRNVRVGPFEIKLVRAKNGETKHGSAELLIEGNPVSLTESERRLLSLLTDRLNQWVKKTDIYKELWNAPRPAAKIIDVFACTLRKKISNALPEPLPERTHYLVADYHGNFGLFSRTMPMAQAHTTRGKLVHIGKQLAALSR